MTSSYLRISVFARPTNLRFQKSPTSVPENAGYVWTVAVFGENSLRFRKYPATRGRGPGKELRASTKTSWNGWLGNFTFGFSDLVYSDVNFIHLLPERDDESNNSKSLLIGF